MNEQDKTLEKELTEVQMGSLPDKRVQGNDRKNDQRTWEENGWKEWEVSSLKQRVRKYKEEPEIKSTITEIKMY